MEHAYKLLYLLRPVIWGLFVFLIGIYGNRFYKKILTIVSMFLAIMSVAGVVLSTHLINHVLTAYNMDEYVERNDFVLCYVGVTMTILLLVCSIGYGLMASTVDNGDGKVVGGVLELIGWFWLICVIKYVKNKNVNNDSDN